MNSTAPSGRSLANRLALRVALGTAAAVAFVLVGESVLRPWVQAALQPDAPGKSGSGLEGGLVAVEAVLALVLMGMAALGMGLASRLLVQRQVVAPVEELRHSLHRMAQGDLSTAAPTPRPDEIGHAQAEAEAMRGRLEHLMRTLSEAAQSIATASTEIASGNSDLSGRTEQAASNLEETASSMEDLTGTVRQVADSASTANQLAASASDLAAQGGAAVDGVVRTMETIHQSSRKIADIISVIDGIAFQTNILALNAAVEAARAGEQGRGFAVVAGEVRGLAQRSALAAREIKDLIHSSVQQVEAGSTLVADAGQTMQAIVASVQRVADIIGEVKASATEQSQGIIQVNSAVSQLDQMTQQNAALVEQSAAAAESLKDLAAQLYDMVTGFKATGEGASAAPNWTRF